MPPRIRPRPPAWSLGLKDRRDILAVVALGGALGTLARWGVAQLLDSPPAAFPWSTWTVNVTGCCLMGVLMALVSDRVVGRLVRPFVGVGVLGGYTTYSTYMLDTRDLLAASHVGTAVGYVASTFAGGLLAVYAGLLVGRAAVRLGRRPHGVRHRRPVP